MLERVGMDDALDDFAGDTRQLGALHHGVHVADTGNGFLHAGEGEIGAEEDLVGDVVFLRGGKNIPKLPRAVEQRGYLAVKSSRVCKWFFHLHTPPLRSAYTSMNPLAHATTTPSLACGGRLG
jgi:hypothetical protein